MCNEIIVNESNFEKKQVIIPIETTFEEVQDIICEYVRDGFFFVMRYDYSLDYDVLVFSNDTKNLLIPVEYTKKQISEELKKYINNGYLVVFSDLYNMDYIHVILAK